MNGGTVVTRTIIVATNVNHDGRFPFHLPPLCGTRRHLAGMQSMGGTARRPHFLAYLTCVGIQLVLAEKGQAGTSRA